MAERSSMMPPSDSGTPEAGQPDLLGRGQHLGGRGAGLVGLGGGRAEHLVGQLADHVDEHLLVLGRGEVEDAARLGAGRTLAGGAPTGPGELRPAAVAARKPLRVVE